jgi:AcrR family transcriptional regulator
MVAKAKRGAPPDGERPVDGRHRRRMRTEEKLIAATGELLREGGIAAVGVNAVSERAGVEKVLVYRYFGGIEGLMEAYASRADFWPTLAELVGEDGEVLADPDKGRAGARVLGNYAAALRKRPVTLDLLAWECSQRSPLIEVIEKVREERSRQLVEALRDAGIVRSRDVGEVGILFAAAINYLTVRGRDVRAFGGVGVKTDSDWRHLEALMTRVFRLLLADDG